MKQNTRKQKVAVGEGKISRSCLLILVLLSFLISTTAATAAEGDELHWAVRGGGESSDRGYGIATDASGNSLVTGYFEGTATFGAGDANETARTSNGGTDIFVTKHDPNGALL